MQQFLERAHMWITNINSETFSMKSSDNTEIVSISVYYDEEEDFCF